MVLFHWLPQLTFRKLSVNINNTANSVKSVIAGSGDDNIKIDSVSSSLSSDGRGINVEVETVTTFFHSVRTLMEDLLK